MIHHANNVWMEQIMGLFDGSPQEVRGHGTLERLARQTVVDMKQCMVTFMQRKIGYKFMAAEAIWILSGSDKVSHIEPWAPKIKQFSDDGDVFFGAYGPKVFWQMPYVVEALKKDPSTRQAVINIWRESPKPTKDYPCTLSVQWMIRDNTLHCFDTMRSSDIWLGWPYDIFSFSMVSLAILIQLRKTYPGLKLGHIILTAASQHLYARNVDQAIACTANRGAMYYEPLDPDEFRHVPDLIIHLMAIRDGRPSHYKWMKEVAS